MLSYKFFLIVISIIFFHFNQSWAQAWTRSQGGGYAQLGLSTITYASLYGDGDIDDIELNREVTDRTLQLYGEYGLTDKLTISTSIPLKLLETNEDLETSSFFPTPLESGDLTALGNVSVAGIYKLPQTKNWVATAKLRLDMNTASYEEETGLRTGFDAWGIAPSLNGGYGSKYFFATSEVGLNLRTNNYSHQFFANFQAGINLNQLVFLISTLEVLQSFENGNFDDGNAVQTGLYLNDIQFIAFVNKIGVFPIKNLGLWASVGGGRGNLVARSPSLSFAVSYQW